MEDGANPMNKPLPACKTKGKIPHLCNQNKYCRICSICHCRRYSIILKCSLGIGIWRNFLDQSLGQLTIDYPFNQFFFILKMPMAKNLKYKAFFQNWIFSFSLVQNDPTPHFALTSSCLRLMSAEAVTAARRQLSNVISVFSVSWK